MARARSAEEAFASVNHARRVEEAVVRSRSNVARGPKHGRIQAWHAPGARPGARQADLPKRPAEDWGADGGSEAAHG